MEKQIAYLRKMTDDFGIVQFSKGNIPDIRTGYTIDDVSRALIVSSKLGLEDLSEIYFNFIKNAQTKDGRFVNVYSGEKKPLEKFGSQDSYGRTLWALGEYFNKTEKGEKLINSSLNALKNLGLDYPISESFAIIGLTNLHDSGFEEKKTNRLIRELSNSLVNRINANNDKSWLWPSFEMSYENARIPQALLKAYNSTKNFNYLNYSKALTEFLDDIVFDNDNEKSFLNVIGNSGDGLKGSWYKKGSSKSKYDEQPVDVGGMIELHLDFYKDYLFNENLSKAKISMDWFNGRNRLGKKMISPEGGVYDGLNKKEVNFNQGAESLLSYMMAKIKFDEISGENLNHNFIGEEIIEKINENNCVK
jgi:hypothetical protein